MPLATALIWALMLGPAAPGIVVIVAVTEVAPAGTVTLLGSESAPGWLVDNVSGVFWEGGKLTVTVTVKLVATKPLTLLVVGTTIMGKLPLSFLIAASEDAAGLRMIGNVPVWIIGNVPVWQTGLRMIGRVPVWQAFAFCGIEAPMATAKTTATKETLKRGILFTPLS